MRTTVDISPRVLAGLKARANREKTTIGKVIEDLYFRVDSEPIIKYEHGIPVIQRPEHVKETITSEYIYELMDEMGI